MGVPNRFGAVVRTTLDASDQLPKPSKGRYGGIAGHFSPTTTNTVMPTTTAGPLVAKLVTANHIDECSPSDEDEYLTEFKDDDELDDDTTALDGADEEADLDDEFHHRWHVEILVDGELLQLEYTSCLQTWRLEGWPSNQELWSILVSRYGASSLRCAIGEALDSPLWPGCNY